MNDLPGGAAPRPALVGVDGGEVHKADFEPTGQNPEASSAVWYNAQNCAIF